MYLTQAYMGFKVAPYKSGVMRYGTKFRLILHSKYVWVSTSVTNKNLLFIKPLLLDKGILFAMYKL